MKKLIIFDLDGTLTESKTDVTLEIEQALKSLVCSKKVAVISGCHFNQMRDQFFNKLRSFSFDDKHNLFMLPTSGAELWTWEGPDEGCYMHYSNPLTLREKAWIYNIFEELYLTQIAAHDYRLGEIAEDRGSQITFSLLGQNAPLEIKKLFDPDRSKRNQLAEKMLYRLSGFDIRVGGTTSIDVSKQGINKAYGVRKLLDYIRQDDGRCLEHGYYCNGYDGGFCCNQLFTIQDAVYIGDALHYGGNDAVVKETGIDCIETSGPSQTIEIIKELIK